MIGAEFIGRLAGWKGYTVIAALCFTAGVSAGWTARDWKQGRADADRAEAEVVYRDRIIWRERAQADVSAEVEREAVKEQVHVRTVTETIIKEVPIHVPAEADVRFALPAGLVRVHDAAARGDPLPDPAREPDAAAGSLEPSDVPPSRLATVIALNYGTCRADQARLAGLQGWIRQQQALDHGAPIGPS